MKIKWKVNQLILMIVAIACYGCIQRLPDISVGLPSDYRIKTENRGLAIAIDPFMESSRSKMFFGAHLLANGILAVNIIVQNSTKDKRFILEKKNIFLEIPKEPLTKPGSVQESDKELLQNFSKGSSAVTITSALVLPVGIIVPVLAHVHNKSEAISTSVVKNQIVDVTLEPGTIHHGFVYFQVQTFSEDKPLQMTIRVPIIGEKDILEFKLPVGNFNVERK